MTDTLPRPAGDASRPAADVQDPAGFDLDLDDIARRALADDAVALVRRWLEVAETIPADVAGQRLAGVLSDPRGLEFTVGFVDGVVRPEDLRVAARELRRIAPIVPRFLPWYLRAAVRLGGAVAPLMPGVVVPIARRVLRSMVGHLIVDASPARLGPAIARIAATGARRNINLLGEAVLGKGEAARRLEGTHRLLARDDVDYVSIKVSSTVAPHSPWAFDAAVDDIVASLTPLFERAAAASPAKFINLDMEEYKDLELTIAVFTRILDQPRFHGLEAGIVLQAYLPDALAAMMRLQAWSAARRAHGGASIKVRVVKGANLPMEQVEASRHDWPLATWGSKQDSDTSYKRVLAYALQPDRVANVRVGIAGHNLFDVAFAWLLAKRRGVETSVEFEMLLGMAVSQAEAVRRDVGDLLLYTPVVHPEEFDVAIAYLIRRLEEGAGQENFMSAVFRLSDDSGLFERERDRFLRSLQALDGTVPGPNRTQDRRAPQPPAPAEGFRNTPDTDPSLPQHQAWGASILARVPGSRLGIDTVEASVLETSEALDAVVDGAVASSWSTLSGAERAAILHRAGEVLEARRADLMEVAASEAGKTLDQSDPEVSEAIDFAHYYAERAKDLDRVDGATPRPVRLTVVTPPWNFPVAIPAGSTLAALAAGSPVVVKPARQARRCGAAMVEALWEAGVPRDALRFVQLADNALGRRLIGHPSVDRVILTGGIETAELFRSFRRDLPLLAETSGKNAVIVTPSADLDLAAKDVVASAFGHAGQKCSAASLVILVGSVATSRRFRSQLLDAVRSLEVGPPEVATTQMGPLIGPASGKLLQALTTLEPGQSWLVEPERLDEEGRLWSPGVREGVQRGSEYHLTEYFGPILGIMTAETLEEAIAIQNEIDYGLTAGLHSLDADELATWLDRVQAGNLYVNRGITGAIVQRQPFGGWKRSAVGAGTKAGGPSYLMGLTDWEPREATAPVPASSLAAGPARALVDAARDAVSEDELASLERAIGSDARVWATELGVAHDVTGLSAERNVLRHLPHPAIVRLAEGGTIASLVRVVAAAAVAGAPVSVSTGVPLPDAVRSALAAIATSIESQDDAAWLRSVATAPRGAAGLRIRLLGAPASTVAAATDGTPDIAVYAGPVTEAGRLELLPFVQEQAVSITAHRFGTPSALSEGLL